MDTQVSVPSIDRRKFLTGAATLAAAAAVWKPAALSASSQAGQSGVLSDPFTLGVGSGDPLPDRVVLWTRLAPDPLNGGGMPDADVTVDWELATDPTFDTLVASGSALAPAAFAHSVHVDAGAGPEGGLTPATEYFYRFTIGDFTSPTGRTRTTPPPDADVSQMSFAFASCQSYASGYYHAHHHIAAEPDLDLVLFLGDYIYENGSTSPPRPVPGGEATTLLGYRNRYALYRADPDLQAAHQRCPWVVVWDDHEVDNDYAGDISQDNDPVEQFRVRRAEAYLAWWEHQAVRMPAPVGPDLQIYRSLRWGQLVTFFALDGRQYRDDQADCPSVLPDLPAASAIAERCGSAEDDERTMLGASQEQWLDTGLRASPCRWNVVAQQTVFAGTPLQLPSFPTGYNLDQWDGYPAARQRLLDTFASPEVNNPLVVTGDIHASGAGYLLRTFDPDRGAGGRIVGHEFVGTSISSTFPAALVAFFNSVAGALPWIDYVNASLRGYVKVTLTPTRATARWKVVDSVSTEQPRPPVRTDHVWVVPAVEPDAAPRFIPARFSDVPPSVNYATAVDWLKANGVTTGVGGTSRFAPTDAVTRGQMASFLWRMMGEPALPLGTPPTGFTDVPANAAFAPAVAWLKAKGITTGTSSTTFSPAVPVNRGQMALFLWRLAGEPLVEDPSGFDDINAGALFENAVKWAKFHGITTGTSPTNYSPAQPVTRAQMALFLYRLASTPQAWSVALPPTAVVD